MVELLKSNAELITRYIFILCLFVFSAMIFMEVVVVMQANNQERVDKSMEARMERIGRGRGK